VNVRTLSLRFGAAALVVGPLAIVVGSLFQPFGDSDSVSVSLAKVARHQSDQRALIVCDLIAGLMLPAVLYLMRLTRTGAPRLSTAGGAIAFLGWFAGTPLAASDVLYFHAARFQDRASAVTLVTSVTKDAGFGVPVLLFLAGHLVGMLLLGIALWRSHAVPTWAAALVGIGPIVHIAMDGAGSVANACAFALVLVGMSRCAVQLLRSEPAEITLPATSFVAADVPTQSPVSR
jgi:hypothetical protein